MISKELIQALKDNDVDKIKSFAEQESDDENLQELVLSAFKYANDDILKYLIERKEIRMNAINSMRIFAYINHHVKRQSRASYILKHNICSLTEGQKHILQVWAGEQPEKDLRIQTEVDICSSLWAGPPYSELAVSFIEESPNWLNQSVTSINQEMTVLWWLAYTLESRAILQAHPDLLQKANLDAAPVSGPNQGMTVLWWMAATPEGKAILQAHPELLQVANLNAAPTSGPNQGTTVTWCLAASPEGRAILQAYPELLQEANLDAAPVSGPHQGKTVLWYLAASREGRAILQAHPELLQKANLDAAPVSGPHQGMTVLWWMASTPEGQAILQAHPELLQKANLDVTPVSGPNQGKTVTWWLASTPEGRAILQAHPELLQNANLDAAPASGQDQGKTVLFLLVTQHVFNEPDFVKKILSLRGFSKDEFAFVRNIGLDTQTVNNVESKRYLLSYQDLHLFIKELHLDKLHILLIQEPWLLETRHGKKRDTVLHVLLRALDRLPPHQLIMTLNKYDDLLDKLKILKSLENRDEFMAAEYVSSPTLKHHFLSLSDFEMIFMQIFTKEIMDLVKAIIVGKIKLNETFHVDVISNLEETFDQLIGCIEIYPVTKTMKLLVASFLAETQDVREEINKALAVFEMTLLPERSINEREAEMFNHFISNFSHLITAAFHKAHAEHRSEKAHLYKRSENLTDEVDDASSPSLKRSREESDSDREAKRQRVGLFTSTDQFPRQDAETDGPEEKPKR